MSILMEIVTDPGIMALGSSILGGLGFARLIEWEFDRKDKAERKALEPVVVDGRTHQEWYDLVHSMGKDAVEDMALGPLDGLERAAEYGWDYKKLLGPLYQTLEKEWYPERYVVQAETLMPSRRGPDGVRGPDGIKGPNAVKAIDGDREAAELKKRTQAAVDNYYYYSDIKYNYNRDTITVSNTPHAKINFPDEPKPVAPVKTQELKSVSFRHPKMDPDVRYMRRGEELVQLVPLETDDREGYKVFDTAQISAYQQKHMPSSVTGIVDTYTLWRMQEEFYDNGKISIPQYHKEPKPRKLTAEEVLENKFAQQIRAMQQMEDKHKEYQKYLDTMFQKW